MRFNNGEEALMWLTENWDCSLIISSILINTMLLRITEDDGVRLEYDNGSISLEPMWAELVETAVDIKKIFQKSLTHKQQATLLKWALDPNATKDGNTLYYRGVKNFEKALRREGYISENAALRYLDDLEKTILSEEFDEEYEKVKKIA
jgi:hypothetical protein